MTDLPVLYTYWRSGSSYRLRIALALKGVGYDSLPVHLVRDGGEQNEPAYRAVNPQGRVPALRLPTGDLLTQSHAIIEYLEETIPETPLLPANPLARARVRTVASVIGCDVQPLNNVAVLNVLRRAGQDDTAVTAWIARWITAGFDAVERLIDEKGWCFGPEPGLADLYLIPQIYSADRFKVALADYSRINRVHALADGHPAFQAAHPANQPDADR